MTSPRLSTILDAAERQGRLNLSAVELLNALPHTSAEALRQAIHRQQTRGRLIQISRGSGHYLIVPLQYSVSGAPPLEIWLDHYFTKTLRSPYYVGLLSAAESYGASPYGVMVTQVFVPKPRRPIKVGRQELVFYVRANVQQMPTRWHETQEGRFKVSTPELTALELVQHNVQVGGVARVQQVLEPLCESFSTIGLQAALNAVGELSVAQRLGVLLSAQGKADWARVVKDWLQGRKIRAVSLNAGVQNGEVEDVLNATFKVRHPSTLESSNA